VRPGAGQRGVLLGEQVGLAAHRGAPGLLDREQLAALERVDLGLQRDRLVDRGGDVAHGPRAGVRRGETVHVVEGDPRRETAAGAAGAPVRAASLASNMCSILISARFRDNPPATFRRQIPRSQRRMFSICA
jgi:hypothetical protein